jgi:hypothetical protein
VTGPLLNTTDFAKFQAKDPSWFLGAVAETITDYCGWHIFPVVSVTGVRAQIGAAGIIMLPTLNLVSVKQIVWETTVLDPMTYDEHDSGWIEILGLPGRQAQSAWVTVDFTHGYDEVPKAVAEVGYELASRTIEKPAGVVTDMTRGTTRLKFQEFGAVLSDDQKNRLQPYTLLRV